jgi:hypothetical protein
MIFSKKQQQQQKINKKRLYLDEENNLKENFSLCNRMYNVILQPYTHISTSDKQLRKKNIFF